MLARRQGEAVAPTLSALAARGQVFTQAYSQSAWTLPAAFSLLTGRYPLLVEVRDDTFPQWDRAVRTLPQILGYYGYHSSAWWGHTILSDGGQFGQGFSDHHDPSDQGYGIDLAGWISHQDGAPFLALVHDIDLHNPMPPIPAQDLHRFVPAVPGCPAKQPPSDYETLRGLIGEQAAQEHIRGHYDGQVRAYDDAVADMLAQLDRAGVADHTVVIVLSDHGEELFDRGSLRHGVHYDTVLHIPLLIADPSLGPGTVDTVVQTVDLAPTILERAGIAVDREMDGQSLLPLMGAGAGSYAARDVFSVSNRYNASLRTADWKLLVRSEWEHHGQAGTTAVQEGGRITELYDLQADPGEGHDLLAQRPEVAESLEARLEAWRQARLVATGQVPRSPLEEHQKEQLQQRGYWGLASPDDAGGPPPPAVPPTVPPTVNPTVPRPRPRPRGRHADGEP